MFSSQKSYHKESANDYPGTLTRIQSWVFSNLWQCTRDLQLAARISNGIATRNSVIWRHTRFDIKYSPATKIMQVVVLLSKVH